MLVFRDSAGSKVSFTLLPVSSPPVEEFWAVSVKKVRLIPSGLIIVMVLAVDPMISPEIADEKYMDEKNRFDLNRARPIVYSHGEYLGTGKKLGTFGYSVKKAKKQAKKR